MLTTFKNVSTSLFNWKMLIWIVFKTNVNLDVDQSELTSFLNFSYAKFFLTLVFRKFWIAFPAIFMRSLSFSFKLFCSPGISDMHTLFCLWKLISKLSISLIIEISVISSSLFSWNVVLSSKPKRLTSPSTCDEDTFIFFPSTHNVCVFIWSYFIISNICVNIPGAISDTCTAADCERTDMSGTEQIIVLSIGLHKHFEVL